MLPVVLLWVLLISFLLESQLRVKLIDFPGMSLINLSLYLLIIYWLFNVFRGRRIVNQNNINTILLLSIVIAAIGIPLKMLMGEVGPVHLWDEISYFKGWVVPLVLFFIFYNINDNKTYKAILMSLYVFFIITLVVCIVQGVRIDPAVLADPTDLHGRLAGFSEANQYAAFLALFSPLAFSGFICEKKLSHRVIHLVVLVGAFVALLNTGSRGGTVALVTSLFVLLVLLAREGRGHARKFITMGIILVIVIFVAAILAQGPARERILTRFSKTDNLDNFTAGRTLLWRDGMVLFLESPFYGHGQNTFLPLMLKRFRVYGASHNDFLMEMVTKGLIGLGLFLALFVAIARRVRSALLGTSDEWLRRIYISYLAGLAGYVVAMLSVNVMDPAIMFWIFTATVYASADKVTMPGDVLNEGSH